jgi:hypothetical protein
LKRKVRVLSRKLGVRRSVLRMATEFEVAVSN